MGANDSTSSSPRHIVGIGASAGGLTAIQRFFRELSLATHHTNDSYIVVQHLPSGFKSSMDRLLQNLTLKKVCFIENGLRLSENHIYILPAGNYIELDAKGVFTLTPGPKKSTRPIDNCFSSLAAFAKTRAVGVILSGTGNDGKKGALDIVHHGGKIYAQSLGSADFDGMPRALLATQKTSGQGTPEELARLFAQSLSYKPRDKFAPLYALLEEQGQPDFSLYKSTTIHRRIQKNQASENFKSIHEYADSLRESPQKAQQLGQDLLIGVTSFFRDPEVFEKLQEKLIQNIQDNPPKDKTIRAWVAGCSTGEEAYTLSILFSELQSEHFPAIDFRIFATDVKTSSLAQASRGFFLPGSLTPLSEEQIQRYFVPHKGGFVVSPELRNKIVFAEHNLLKHPPFTRMDLITCRNVLIYFKPELQERVCSLFEFGLRPGGLLLLGSSESLPLSMKSFTHEDRKYRIFSRNEVKPSHTATQSIRHSTHLLPTSPIQPLQTEKMLDLHNLPPAPPSKHLNQVMERYVPDGFLIDDHRNILHSFGKSHQYVEYSGPITTDLVKLLREDLQLAATGAIHQTFNTQETTRVVAHHTQGEASTILEVEPMGPSSGTYFVRIYKDEETPPPPAPLVPPSVSEIAQQRILELETELTNIKEQLQVVIAELETSNEELQTTNEELISSNEELQSTNEELQATNEELHSVNAEYEQKHTELLELHNDLTVLMHCTGIGLVFLNHRLEIRKFTPAIQQAFRLRQQDIGRPLEEIASFLDGKNNHTLLSRIREVIDTGEVCENSTATRQGVVLLERIHPYRDEDGAILGAVLSYIDLSQLEETKRALQEAEAQNKSILNALDAHIAVVDSTGNISTVNESWTRFAENNQGNAASLGKGSNYIGTCLKASHLEPNGDAHNSLLGIQSVLRGDLPRFELLYPCHAPHEKRWFLMRVTPIGSDNGGAVIAHVNVTKQELLRRELAKHAGLKLLGAAVDAAPNAIFVYDQRGIVSYTNASFERMLGYNRHEIPPEVLRNLFLHNTEKITPQQIQEELRNHHRWNGQLSLATRSGGKILVEMTLSPIPNEEGEVERILVVCRDIAEQKQKELHAQREQKLASIGTLVGGIAHDFNNVLNSIMGYTQLLRPRVQDDKESARDLQHIHQATLRARDLVRQILTFSRQTTLQTEKIQPGTVVKECIQLLRGSIPNSVEIDLALDPKPLWIEANPTQLHQVMMNLVTNAYQAIDKTGRISVSVSQCQRADENQQSQQCVKILVRDNGAGMDTTTLQRLFEPFYTTKTEGTGMGLSVVHGIVQSLGGELQVESTPGLGTSMAVVLPLTSAPPNLFKPIVSKDLRGSETIFVVDDERPLTRLIARILKPMGYQVQTFSSAEEVLEALEEETPALLLSDNNMPRTTGLELFETLREKGEDFPVVLMSGYIEESDIANRGFASVLPKPFTHQELQRCIKAVLHPSSR